MIEIKPYHETHAPKINRNKRRFLEEQVEFARNHAKWEAATEYCKKRNWIFKIITQKDIKFHR